MSTVCYLPNISISCVPAFNLDNEQPDYDMDSEDETLLNRLNRKMEIKPLQFEIMVDRLEKASSSQVWSEEIIERFCFPEGWFWVDVWFISYQQKGLCGCSSTKIRLLSPVSVLVTSDKTGGEGAFGVAGIDWKF